MPYIGENFIHLPNPDYSENEFRGRPGTKDQLNIVGSTTFGNGIEARYGLLKTSGATAIVTYLFPKDRFDMASAQRWLDEHKRKVSKEDLINKEFTAIIPIVKHYMDDNGTLFLKGEASNLKLDLQGDEMQVSAIDDMKEQSIGKTGFLNHKYDIGKDDFGVIVGYEKSEDKFTPIFEVFDDKKEMLLNRLEKGAKFGLSVGGRIRDAVKEAGRRIIKSVRLKEVSLTYFPANDSTLGTVGIVKENICMGGLCNQIFKSIDEFEGGFTTVNPVYLEKGDDIMGIEIPEDVNLEKGVAEKIKEASKDNKALNFIKTLIGVKDEGINKQDLKPEEIKALSTACTGGDAKACSTLKDAGITKEQIDKIMKKEKTEGDDIIKTEDKELKKQINKIITKNDELEQTVYNQGKLIKEQGETIETLKKDTTESKKELELEKHNTLVKETLESYSLLKEEVKDEDALKEKLEKDEGFTKEEIEKDMDGCLKEVKKANERAASKIKEHPNPSILNPITKEQNDKYKKKVEDMKKEVEAIGT